MDGSSSNVTACRDGGGAVRVPDGWSVSSWIERLEYLSGACRDLHPNLSEEYRVRAERLRCESEDDGAGLCVLFGQPEHDGVLIRWRWINLRQLRR
jgi:hypothetical protein